MGHFPVTCQTNLGENVLWVCLQLSVVLVSAPAGPELSSPSPAAPGEWAGGWGAAVPTVGQLISLNREKAGTVQCYLQYQSPGWKENSSSQSSGEQERETSLAGLLLALIMLSHCITWPHMPGHRNVFLCATPVQLLVLDKHSQRHRDGSVTAPLGGSIPNTGREVRNHCQHSKTVCNPCVKHLHKSVNSRDKLCSRSFLSSLSDCQGKMPCQVGNKHSWSACY